MRLKVDFLVAVVLLVSAILFGGLLLLNDIYAPFANRHTESYRYPGNGIGFLSVNKRITNLECEIFSYSNNFPGIKKVDERIVIDNINNFRFKSLKEIDIIRFSIEIGILVKSGRCDIGIGDIHVKLGGDEVIVMKGENIIGKKVVKNLHSIRIHNWSDNSGKGKYDLLFQANGLPIDIPSLKLEKPSHITIEPSDDFSGSIGPWTWVRGYE